MNRISLLLLFVVSSVSAQTWNLSVGANTTNFVYTNSQGVNPTYLKPGTGLNMTLGYEKAMSRRFQYDLGLSYSQYNAVGDVQNFTLMLKARGAVQTMVNGNQFLQNRYVDLAEDDQFTGLRYFVGFSLELEKKVNQNAFVFAQYQHLDTIQFGTSTLNFVPSTFSFGIKLQSK
jgi:hypothetical protein